MKDGSLKIVPLLLGMTFVGAVAHAQTYAAPGAYGPTEQFEVIVPRFRTEGTPLRGAPDRVSLSVRVRYDDLNLLSWQGEQELRQRVRQAARETCARLADAYPFYPLSGTSCYKSALDNALLRADEAVDDARMDYRRYGDQP